MRLGLGIGIDKTNIAAISGGLRARFLGTGTQYAQLGPITRQLSAAMTGDGTQTTDLLVTKRFAPNYTGDGTLAATLDSYDYLLSGNGDAAVAYSIRLLNPEYSGALVLIRRSSDNAEKAFYPDANFELSLTSEDGASTTLSSWIGSDNGFVKTWYDQSGNSNNATQTSASLQNRIINAGVLDLENGKAALNDTVGGNYNLTDVTLTGADGYYIIGVYKNDNAQKIVNRTGSHIWPYNASNIEYRESGVTIYPAGITTNNGSQTLFRFARDLTDNVKFKMNSSEVSTASADSGKQLIFNQLFLCAGTKQELVAFASNKFADDSTLIANVNNYYSAI